MADRRWLVSHSRVKAQWSVSQPAHDLASWARWTRESLRSFITVASTQYLESMLLQEMSSLANIYMHVNHQRHGEEFKLCRLGRLDKLRVAQGEVIIEARLSSIHPYTPFIGLIYV